jgi:adenosylmethionine-8-amino-7-oxononanoate aminotransferase
VSYSTSELISQDLKHNWHPCSQMKDYEDFKPLVVSRASGSYIELADGRKIIDAISSWWCKSLGHQHPRLKQALLRQIERFEHVIFANTTHDVIVSLSHKLASLLPSLNKIFYAGDGSCAVEIAMKMSVHARQIQGDVKKTKFIALENGYHGETVGALSVSDLGIYRDPYRSMLFETNFLSSLPYVVNVDDPLWSDCSDHWNIIEKTLAPLAETTTAIIVEPILQGAGGMKLYSQDFLRRLRAWTREHNVHLIADEIMTGVGRTGKMLACEHANIEPDFLCLSKGLTSGWMPFSAVLTSENMYQLFYDDYEKGKSFLHSHTFTGNALAASVALEVLTIFEEENILGQVQQLEKNLIIGMQKVREETNKITNIRNIGGMIAADLICDPNRRLGFEIFQEACRLGAFLRPLGNTIYWIPPLNTEGETIQHLARVTIESIQNVY